MSFPQYPKYKDSGVEWLGEVPEHWAVLPCRAIVHERTAKNDDAKCEDYLSLMANIGVIPYAEKGDVGNKKPEDVSKCKIVTRGDFVINSMNYGIGSYGLSEYDGVCSPVYIVLKPQNNIVRSRFAFRIFENRAFQTFAQSFGNGILEHRCAINWDILKPIGVGVPPLDEQKAILDFLDGETGKIDALVAEQRRLIELLKEKRQAVISHAVTKGFNPNAPLKPSGIEWLGDVPENWSVTRLGYYSSVENGMTPSRDDPTYWNDGNIPWLSSGEVNQYRVSEAYEFITRAALEATSLRVLPVGAVIIGMIGQGKTRGLSAMLEIEATINQNMAAVITKAPLLGDYLHFVFQTVYEYLREGGRGGQQAALNCEILRAVRIPLPPTDEQAKIVARLHNVHANFDALTAEAERAISLLQERRTALISAAVTGKIDVRGSYGDTREVA